MWYELVAEMTHMNTEWYGWAVAVITVFGGAAGWIGLYQARATKRTIESETMQNIVESAGTLVNMQRDLQDERWTDFEKELIRLTERVQFLEKQRKV